MTIGLDKATQHSLQSFRLPADMDQGLRKVEALDGGQALFEGPMSLVFPNRRAGVGWDRGQRQPAQQGLVEQRRVHRLGNVVVHAGGQAGVAVLAEGVGGHRDDRRGLAGAPTDRPCRGKTVEHGHLHVHQDQVVAPRRGEFDRARAVLRSFNHQVHAAQQFFGHFPVDRIVFSQQHPLPGVAAPQQNFGFARLRRCRLQDTPLPAQHALQGVVQGRGSDRLDKHGVVAHVPRLLPHHRLVEGGHQDARRCGRTQHAAQLAQRFDAVERRHAPVDQYHVEGPAGDDLGLNTLQRGAAAGLGVDVQPEHLQLVADCGQGLGQIVHQQGAQAGQRDCCNGLAGRLGVREPGGEPKRAALARHAVQAGLAAHQASQVAGQREPEARAAMAARGGIVGLLERREQSCLMLRSDARSGVLHLETHMQASQVLGQQFATQPYPALLGELDGVREQVDQRLRQSSRVAAQAIGQMADVQDHLQPLVVGQAADHFHRARYQFVEREVGVLQRHLAGLDLGQVEDVVDDLQQVLGGAIDLGQAFALLRVARVATHQVGEADDGVHRRADLVAHVGQERALGAVGRLGLVGPADELDLHFGDLPFACLALAVVDHGGAFRDEAALAVANHDTADQRRQQAAVLADEVVFQIAHPSGLQEPGELLAVNPSTLGRHEFADLVPEHLVERVAQQRQGGLVDFDEPAVGPEREIAARRAIVEIGEGSRARRQRAVGRLELDRALRDQDLELRPVLFEIEPGLLSAQ